MVSGFKCIEFIMHLLLFLLAPLQIIRHWILGAGDACVTGEILYGTKKTSQTPVDVAT